MVRYLMKGTKFNRNLENKKMKEKEKHDEQIKGNYFNLKLFHANVNKAKGINRILFDDDNKKHVYGIKYNIDLRNY